MPVELSSRLNRLEEMIESVNQIDRLKASIAPYEERREKLKREHEALSRWKFRQRKKLWDEYMRLGDVCVPVWWAIMFEASRPIDGEATK
jgi:chromosome segregation ATPase